MKISRKALLPSALEATNSLSSLTPENSSSSLSPHSSFTPLPPQSSSTLPAPPKGSKAMPKPPGADQLKTLPKAPQKLTSPPKPAKVVPASSRNIRDVDGEFVEIPSTLILEDKSSKPHVTFLDINGKQLSVPKTLCEGVKKL